MNLVRTEVGEREAARLLAARCGWPSEALVRYCEWQVVRGLTLEAPLLEIGCGNGVFAELCLTRVDEAVDLEPRNVAKASRRSGTYRAVRRGDALTVDLPEAGFGTVFANSVLTEVTEVDRLLARARRWLRPGGQLVASVPLAAVADAFAFGAPWYRQWRIRQLSMHNRWTAEEWRLAAEAAGFAEARIIPYLFSGVGRWWDGLDVVACLGPGRYKLATAVSRALDVTGGARRRHVDPAVARWVRRTEAEGNLGEPWMAFLLAH